MKAQVFFAATLLVSVLCLLGAVDSIMLAYDKEYNITNFVEDSDIVVFGWVVGRDFASRQSHGYTTLITIDVIETIKGTPKVGDPLQLTFGGGECGASIETLEGEPEFELGEEVLLFLEKYTHGGYCVFRDIEGRLPVEPGGQVLVSYTLDKDVVKKIYLPVNLVIQIGKAAVKDPEASRRLEEDIKAYIKSVEQLTDRLKLEAKAIQEAAPPPTTEERVIQLSNTITGLDRLASVRIKVDPFTLDENDDTPILSIKKRLLDSRHLWKVSYQVDALRHENMVNPHIKGFDVYLDIATGQVLKIVSRDAEELPQEYRSRITVSNQQIRSTFRHDLIKWLLPAVTPAYTLGDFLTGAGEICRHYECYYILFRTPNRVDNKDIPMWLVIRYGTEPIEAVGVGAMENKPPPKPRTRADGYVRTFQIYFVDATSGEVSPFKFSLGEDDTFR